MCRNVMDGVHMPLFTNTNIDSQQSGCSINNGKAAPGKFVQNSDIILVSSAVSLFIADEYYFGMRGQVFPP